MNILFFAHFAGSPHHGMVYGHYFLAREWVNGGHNVTIVAASYAHTRYAQPVQSRQITAESIDGIRYVWVPAPPYDPRSGIGRVRNILSFSFRCRFSKLPIEHADVVICSSHHPFPIYAARRYARKFNARLVFEVRDLWPLSLIELGDISRKNPFIAWMQCAEDQAYKKADHVVSVLPGAKEYMISHGMAPEKFIFIPNGTHIEEKNQVHPLPDAHVQQMKKWKGEGRFLIGYAGKLGLSNALHTLLEALALCRDEQIAVVLMGSGAFLNDLKTRASELHIEDSVLFLDPVSKEQVASFLELMDITYIGLQKKPMFQYGVSPTKLNDFMLAGKPVIYAVDAPGNIVEESGGGISCEPEDPEALSRAMLAMKNLGQARRDEMGARGRAWIMTNRDYRVLAERFLAAVTRNPG